MFKYLNPLCRTSSSEGNFDLSTVEVGEISKKARRYVGRNCAAHTIYFSNPEVGEIVVVVFASRTTKGRLGSKKVKMLPSDAKIIYDPIDGKYKANIAYGALVLSTVLTRVKKEGFSVVYRTKGFEVENDEVL